ncbi:MAG: bifunctional phosphoribosyl-AMP cyclohydrolase/phosphoribosyl-ATP diphosphatase HisIE [Thermoanaerobaculia bacterium]
MSLESSLANFALESLRYDAAGLLPVVAQDAFTGRVLMLAWANAEAVERTIATAEAHFWSRSRQSLWRKGETSGNVLRVQSIERDCDGDALLLRVLAAGPACHTGSTSCFDGDGGDRGGLDLGALERIVRQRAAADPKTSYTAQLLSAGIERMAQKVGEEATEVVIAALGAAAAAVSERNAEKLGKGRMEVGQRLIEEASDLLFHLTVLLTASGVTSGDLASELSARHRHRSRAADEGSPPFLDKGAERTAVAAERSEPRTPSSGK